MSLDERVRLLERSNKKLTLMIFVFLIFFSFLFISSYIRASESTLIKRGLMITDEKGTIRAQIGFGSPVVSYVPDLDSNKPVIFSLHDNSGIIRAVMNEEGVAFYERK